MIPLTLPVINGKMIDSAIHALSNEMLVGGESVIRFEEEFAKYVGTDYAISANSGSSALLLTFYALNTKYNNKVVAPSATFIATVNGACILGARPLFCEIGADYLMDLKQLEKIVKKNEIKCVIPVHLYGQPCDISFIRDIVKGKKIFVVEDAAQAHGAQLRNKKVGCLGDAAVFSFYPTKNMTVGGDGGMITTNSKTIYESVLKMRDVGRRTKYTHDKIGYTMRLNSVNAAIGKVQLRYLDAWNEKRRTVANKYRTGLRGVGDLILPPEDAINNKSVYHLFVLKTQKRDILGTWLTKNGISTGVHYPLPVHRQPAYHKFRGDPLPLTDEWSRTVLSIPMHPELESQGQEFVINTITKFYDEKLYQSKELKQEEKIWSARLN